MKQDEAPQNTTRVRLNDGLVQDTHMNYAYAVVIGSSLRGIIKVVGPFSTESEAQRWIDDNPQDYGEAVVTLCENPSSREF
jgi:hypothetical protein